jgi:hypothetical protein
LRRALSKLGYYDIKSFPHLRYTKDVFGFDAVAKKVFVAGHRSHIYWIQFKSNYIPKSERQAIRDFCKEFDQRALIVEYVPSMKRYINKKGSYLKERKIKITEVWGDGERGFFV